MSVFQYVLQAAPGAGEQWLPIVVVVGGFILLMYFFIMRPQKKERQRHQQMMDSIKKNDKVITIGGMHGTVFAVKENTVVLKIDENSDVKIRVNRSSIAAVISQDDEGEEEGDKEKQK